MSRAEIPPSGEQFELVHGEQRATVVEVGGGLREYSVGGREVLEPYPRMAICDGAHGTPLIPWPNRLGGGRYSFEGVERQLALTEPARRNAIHGLMRWRPWRALLREPSRVVMAARLHPRPGYPFMLDLEIAYELDEAGMSVTTTALNVGAGACPYGAGQHPYLSPGEGRRIDECTLTLGADTRITVDDASGLPCGREPVAGTELDFAAPRSLDGARLDLALTDLHRGDSGVALARLAAPDGSIAELWADEHHPVIQLYTGDTLSAARRRRGIAVEPMTCPPNAFQSGEGLIRLEPGESVSTRWGARLS